MQVAFQYSLLTHRGAATDEDAAVAVGGKVYALQRRLRVLTVMPGVAKTHEAVYGGAQLDAVATMLSHKVLLHSVRSGAADARVLLQVRCVASLLCMSRSNLKLSCCGSVAGIAPV